MLDADTKRRIDTARDILVGKVPDPKSQVEQITIALIYKFMDDIDAESEELGGKRTFFGGDFTRYGWAKLMSPGIGGHETLNLYAEAITRMPENPGIPRLFRDIFNNAYLPYRDPETLRAFLKVINEFTYDHSERLGDAFEYLLSVLGAQGDAGQFRTPRHIIDFIVSIVDPKKDEVVLDPACGTAGFLISAYKHILAANTDGDGQSTLTPDARGQLVNNFRGYDISPDMVRLSLVNMYLHGFVEPKISEYDTLTSDERWNEFADVILANPPFMSPKGGIRPHNRFSIQSKRSEVLFVDYMAEHLTANGRAGIIVPEGIIFQSQNAHKRLRKMLLDTSLVAVVSLPAGVFKPYSGVKTSILILDKSLARRTDNVAFFKVENDGFDLGDQRRPSERNDIPKVQAELSEYLRSLRAIELMGDFQPTLGVVVEKRKIASDGEFNLSGERYREPGTGTSTWPVVAVKELFKRSEETVLPETLPGPVNYVGLENIISHTGRLCGDVVVNDPTQVKSLKNVFCKNDILYGRLRPNLNKVWLADRDGFCSTDIIVIRPAKEARVLPGLYAHFFRSVGFNAAVLRRTTGAQLPRISWTQFQGLTVPLPPLSVQREVVEEIEGYQRVIDGARGVVENYRPHIVVDPEWPLVAIKEIADVTSSKRILAEEYVPVGIPFYRTKEVVELSRGDQTSSAYYISQDRFRTIRASFGAPSKGDILVSAVGTIGTAWVVPDNYDFYFKDGNLLWIKNVRGADPNYLKHCMDSVFSDGMDNIVFGAAYKALTIVRLKEIKIPLPSLETQQAIVTEIESEQEVVNANRKLIERFEKKIEGIVARVWGAS